CLVYFFHVLNTGNDNMVFLFFICRPGRESDSDLEDLEHAEKLRQVKAVLEEVLYREPFGMAHGGNFSGIYRNVQLKPLKWDGEGEEERPVEALMILKYGGVLAHAGRKQVFTYFTI
ncbi:hypothetical protein HID58_002384, partial [Brassica napus]